jgi:hypothetical protein
MNRFIIASLLTLGFLPALASAQSLEEKKYRKEQEGYLKEKSSDPMNEKCGTKIDVSIDWSKFKLDEIKSKNVSTYGYCETAANVIWHLCDDADAKPEVVKKVKKIVCKYGGPGKRGMTLKGGTLEWIIDWDAANADDYVKEFLMKNL